MVERARVQARGGEQRRGALPLPLSLRPLRPLPLPLQPAFLLLLLPCTLCTDSESSGAHRNLPPRTLRTCSFPSCAHRSMLLFAPGPSPVVLTDL
mmetsp:Transcript_79339/g.119280  ORF Transcript_79339/g.119280 Transcript_79339/m.119280 type:complete len:95 (+) Transcript_79339:308-592(+)